MNAFNEASEIAVIAAFSENHVIGNKGRIPWDLPGDRLHFKELTMGHAVIFGRKTFEEIGRPLPRRFNIVVSGTKKFSCDDGSERGKLVTVESLEEGLAAAGKAGYGKIFLCGGEKIYREGMKYASEIFTTQIHRSFEGDAFFPEIDLSIFTVTSCRKNSENSLSYDFIDYSRRLHQN